MTTNPYLGWRLKTEYNYTSTPTLCLRGLFYDELTVIIRMMNFRMKTVTDVC